MNLEFGTLLKSIAKLLVYMSSDSTSGQLYIYDNLDFQNCNNYLVTKFITEHTGPQIL